MINDNLLGKATITCANIASESLQLFSVFKISGLEHALAGETINFIRPELDRLYIYREVQSSRQFIQEKKKVK
jgi:hypothetical protein